MQIMSIPKFVTVPNSYQNISGLTDAESSSL